MAERLQKILSAAGIASRRTAETLIGQGRVTVNGRTVTELGTKADPNTDEIRVDGRRVKGGQRRRYILLYKPRGYITTRSDPQNRPTVIDLLATGGVKEYVYPVGRLDYDSEGLLLLTSDGELAAHLAHPRHGVEREYEVRVKGVPDAHDLDRLSRGISLEGRRTAPARVEITKVIEADSGPQALVSFVIHEGRNRQVRNMCDAIGHPVARLRRIRIGPITDEHIRPGEFRDLTPQEIALLRKSAMQGAAKDELRDARRFEAAPQARPPGQPPPRLRRPAGASRKAGAEWDKGPPPLDESSGRPEFRRRARATARGGPGDEVPRTIKEARPRSEPGARSRRSPGGDRPRRG
jgi:23S rRNA pseudouridine2605 synthase